MVSAINVRENLIDRMEVEISNYLIKMTDQELNDDESHDVTELLNFVTEYERIGDYAVNIQEKAVELNKKSLPSATLPRTSWGSWIRALEKILTRTVDAFENDDVAYGPSGRAAGRDHRHSGGASARPAHQAPERWLCSIDTGVVFLDVLNNVERISDHCSNVAARLVGMRGR